MAAACRLRLKPSSNRSLVSRCFRRFCSLEGAWDTLEVWILSLGCSTGLTMGVDVENRTHLWGVTGTSSSCSSTRMSSRVSPLKVGRFPRSGTWPTLSAAPLTIFTVPGSTSCTSSLSWAKLWGGDIGGDCGWGLSGEVLNMAWCSAIKLLSLLSSLSCSATLSIAWSCICERAATCCPVGLLLLYNLLHTLHLGIQEPSHLWSIFCSHPLAHKTVMMSTWAHQRFRSTLVSVLLREKDLKTSLWAVLLMSSSSDAICNAWLRYVTKILCYTISKNEKGWMNVMWTTTQSSGITQSHLLFN